MTSHPIPDIECEQQHATLSVPDLAAALDFYTTKLGFRLAFTWGGDPPSFAGVNLGHMQIFLDVAPVVSSGISLQFLVSDVDAMYEYHRATGVEVIVDIEDREYGIRDYRVRDLNGYELSFGQHLFNAGEPIVIERVDVPLRLEKRLAALLADLAVRKRMSLSSLFEETFLHTLDGVGPHTKGDLTAIQALKVKHQIEYDSHASYRFHE